MLQNLLLRLLKLMLGLLLLIFFVASFVIGSILTIIVSKLVLGTVNTVAEGMSALSKGNYDVRLDLGKGEEAKQLAKDLGAEQAASFLGNVENVPQLLAACDVFVLPSLSEGLPVSMLEAEAAALPVIASHVGGIGDIFCDNGRLIPVNGEEELIKAILELAEDKDLRLKMGESSQKIAEPFAADRIARQYEQLYAKFGRN